MKKIINYIRVGLVMSSLVAAFGSVALVPQAVYAAPADEIQKAVPKDGKSLQDYLKDITNILLFVIGAISVIVIIIGGLKYVTSDGDSAKIKSAKDTIFYAIIGIVVALLAFAIVNFVLGAF